MDERGRLTISNDKTSNQEVRRSPRAHASIGYFASWMHGQRHDIWDDDMEA